MAPLNEFAFGQGTERGSALGTEDRNGDPRYDDHRGQDVRVPRGHTQVGHAFVFGGTLFRSPDCDFCDGCEAGGHETSYLGAEARSLMRAGLSKQFKEDHDD